MLEGKTAIVTGASRGIGKGIAARFLERGANVLMAARNAEALERAAAGHDERRCTTVSADVGRSADVERFVQAAVDRFGGLDILCHNAGIYPESRIEETTEEEWDEVIRTNLTSTFLTIRAAVPHLKQSGNGRIVLMSSITGSRVGYPGLGHYAATKAGMSGFMRVAALEFAPFKITVNGIEPGSIRTEGLDGLGADAIAVMERHIPLGTLGEPQDIADTAVFLASDGARFITGQTIVVDGGQTLPELPFDDGT